MQQLMILGVALTGRDGSPVIVMEESAGGRFLPIPADPFQTEMLIRNFTEENHNSSVSWLAELLSTRPPQRALLELNGNGDIHVRFAYRKQNRGYALPLGEGLSLVKLLHTPLFAEEPLFVLCEHELQYLSHHTNFTENFLYLTPAQYASNIPII
ncbi:MAG: hypothetical protein MI717_03280 [Spirochaetales bacterium]|nr:hypothetical protein [Spirochaetales bacterium]